MTTTHLNDLFDQMEPEKGNKLDDKIDVVDDPDLRELIEKITEIDWHFDFRGKNLYRELSAIFPKKYSADTITKLSLTIKDDNIKNDYDYQFGRFLSYLIQNSEDQNYVINTNHSLTKLSSLGDYNTKNITINGDVGSFTGYGMKAGKILVNGNVKNYTGYQMTGGEIYVNGRIGAVSDIKNGNIFHNSVQIIKDGKFCSGKTKEDYRYTT